jgi:hypothetical protein
MVRSSSTGRGDPRMLTDSQADLYREVRRKPTSESSGGGAPPGTRTLNPRIKRSKGFVRLVSHHAADLRFVRRRVRSVPSFPGPYRVDSRQDSCQATPADFCSAAGFSSSILLRSRCQRRGCRSRHKPDRPERCGSSGRPQEAPTRPSPVGSLPSWPRAGRCAFWTRVRCKPHRPERRLGRGRAKRG